MNMGMQLGQSQRLEQNISPQMLQSAAILQKTAQELDMAINEELAVNPLLELEDESPEESPVDERTDDTDSDDDSIREVEFESGTLDDTADHDYDILENTTNSDMDRRLSDGLFDDDAPLKDLNAPSKDAGDDWDRPQKDRDKSLQDNLRDQLRDWNGTPVLLRQLEEAGCTEAHFRTLIQYLIDSLDENGYLQAAPDDVMMKMASDPGEDPLVVEIERIIRYEVALEDASLPVAEAFHVLRSFTPKGIGARNMQECFLIQAEAIDAFPPLTREILEKHFDDLIELRYGKIAKAMAVSSAAVQQAVAALSRLTPHPGRQLSYAPTQIKHVDLKVEIKKGRIEVECTQESRNKVRRLRVNKYYTDMLSGGVKLDKETREYIQNNKRKAEEFINAANNRFSTMEQVMRAIVKRQPAFFKNGPSFLKPMVLQDIADEVKRDLSTVSRVTNGKYVETPFGIYELKQFFTSGVRQSGKRPAAATPAVSPRPDATAGAVPAASVPEGFEGDDDVVGSARILEAIRNLVDAEDKKKPLSDQAIADALAAEGIQVARRTVAKYREERLKILPARQRRTL